MTRTFFALCAAAMLFSTAATAEEPVIIHPPRGSSIGRSLALSPDGAWIAFAVDGPHGPRLAIASTANPSNVRILGDTAGAQDPFWSPDSKAIGFFTATELRTIHPEGGQSVVRCRCLGAPATWGVHGILLSGGSAPALRWLRPGDRAPIALETKVASNEWDRIAPRFLPDGEHFLYIALTAGFHPSSDLYLSDLAGNLQLLAHGVSGAVMLDAGTAIVRRGLKLHALDVATHEESKLFGDRDMGWFDANGFGAAAWTPAGPPKTQLVWFDRTKNAFSAATPPGHYRRPRISPDGQLLAYQAGDTLVVRTIAGDAVLRTFPTAGVGVAFSPDSHRIAEAMMVDGKCAVVIADLQSGTTTSLLQQCVQVFDWSPDGQQIAVEASQPATGTMFQFVSPNGSLVVRQFIQKTNEGWLRFSPDGKTIAFDAIPFVAGTYNRGAQYSVYLTDRNGGDHPAVKHVALGVRPAWTRIGNDLYFLDAERRLFCVALGRPRDVWTFLLYLRRILFARTRGPKWARDVPRLILADPAFAEYDISPDGRRLIINQRVDAIEFSSRFSMKSTSPD